MGHHSGHYRRLSSEAKPRSQSSLDLLRNLYAEATVRTAHGTTKWFKTGKGIHQAVYCHPAYLTYKHSACMRAKLLQSWPTLTPFGLQPARLLCPWRFSRQGNWSGLSCPPPGIFPIQGSTPHLLHFLNWQPGSLPLVPPGKPNIESTSCEMPGWMRHKLESRLPGEKSITS